MRNGFTLGRARNSRPEQFRRLGSAQGPRRNQARSSCASTVVNCRHRGLFTIRSSPHPRAFDPLSEYELARLRNIARNRQVLEGLGLVEGSSLGSDLTILRPPGPARHLDPIVTLCYPPGRSGDPAVKHRAGSEELRQRRRRRRLRARRGVSGWRRILLSQHWPALGMPPPGTVVLVIKLVSSDARSKGERCSGRIGIDRDHTAEARSPPARSASLSPAPSRVCE